MRAAWAIISIAGCTGGAAGPETIPMNIVVGESTVEVFMAAVDLRTDDGAACVCSVTPFPSVGTCSYVTDANPCSGTPWCRSCFVEIAVEVNGRRLEPVQSGGADPWTRYYDPFPAGELALVMAGCGHDGTRIVLDGPPLPRPTVSASYVSGVPTVAWTTDIPSSSAIVGLYSLFAGDLCHAGDVEQYAFENRTSARSTRVQTLASPVEVATPFGPATVWRGGTAWVEFPPP